MLQWPAAARSARQCGTQRGQTAQADGATNGAGRRRDKQRGSRRRPRQADDAARPTCSAGRMVLAVVHMAPETMPSASPERTIMVPAGQDSGVAMS